VSTIGEIYTIDMIYTIGEVWSIAKVCKDAKIVQLDRIGVSEGVGEMETEDTIGQIAKARPTEPATPIAGILSRGVPAGIAARGLRGEQPGEGRGASSGDSRGHDSAGHRECEATDDERGSHERRRGKQT
jgi:hypothetical protein